MAFPQGIYFRATDDQTDPTNYDAEVSPSANYPRTSAQGNSVGWEQGITDTRDRGGSPVQLAGIHFVGTPAANYRIDLPATGSYNIRLAIGDQGGGQSGQKCQFKDTTTVFATPVPASTSTNSGEFIDATGVLRTTQSDWNTNNAALANTFSTTIFRTALGGSPSGNATIAAVYIESAGGGGGAAAAVNLRSLMGVGT